MRRRERVPHKLEHSGGGETMGFPTIRVGVGRCGPVRTRWNPAGAQRLLAVRLWAALGPKWNTAAATRLSALGRWEGDSGRWR